MRIEPFSATELEFAYCYRICLRWRTYQALPSPTLAGLTVEIAQSLVDRFGLNVLEIAADATDVLCLVSLQPAETIAAAVSKIKGQVSKWLRVTSRRADAERLLSRGYFAITTGRSTDEAVQAYLEAQGKHHGYDGRWAKPPVLVESYAPSANEDETLQAAHSHTLLRLHCVLSTWGRRGAFSQSLAPCVATAWRNSMAELKFALHKVSFVPDHVHLAMRIHPSVSPADLVCRLMNEAQRVWAEDVARRVTPPGLERLWQPSAYLGAYGDLASPQVTAYLRRWQAARQ